jgi:hypothetical protein
MSYFFNFFKIFFGAAIFASLLMSCGEGEKACLLPAPSAIFTADMRGVTAHKFESKGLEANEELVLADLAMRLEILQSGCEQPVQEFRLYLDGTVNDVQTAAATARLVADIFGNIAQIDSEKLKGFMDLAQLLNENAMLFNEFGQATPITTADNRIIEVVLNKTNEPKRTFLNMELRIK